MTLYSLEVYSGTIHRNNNLMQLVINRIVRCLSGPFFKLICMNFIQFSFIMRVDRLSNSLTLDLKTFNMSIVTYSNKLLRHFQRCT